MSRAERAVADRKRLRMLGRDVLPRFLARMAENQARLRALIAIPAGKRTPSERHELGDRMAIWIMAETGLLKDVQSIYG